MPTVVIRVESAPGELDRVTEVPVTLLTRGAKVAGVALDLQYPAAHVRIPPRANEKPDCAVNPDIHKNGTSFAFQPTGCAPGANECTGIRVFVLANDNVTPIDDRARLFSCRFQVFSADSAFSVNLRESEGER